MRYSAVLGLLTSAVLFLAGCGQQSPGGTTPTPTPTPTPVLGNLQVVVKGVDAAKVNVVSGADGKSILDESVAGNRTLSNLPAGSYGVGAANVAGYNAPELKLVTVDGGKTTQVELTFTKQDAGNNNPPPPPPPTPPARLVVEKVWDTWGEELPSVNEGDFNPSKNVRIWASQTEEDVCVKVRVLDAAGSPVPNVQIDVQRTRPGSVSLFSGCVGNPNPAPFTSDASGYVYVRFFAPIGFVPGALAILPTLSDLLGSDLLGPVKVTMAANGTPVTEFKLFFVNISHLYYRYNESAPILTPERLNDVVKNYTNIFKPRPGGLGSTSIDISNNIPAENSFDFATGVLVKQPTGELPTGNSGLAWRYTVTGADASRVDLVGCVLDATTPAFDCISNNGQVSVRPKPDVGLDEMPLDITLNATLYVIGQYGARLAFPLKSLSVTKTWIGTYLTIDKSVSHHVLTWAGSDAIRPTPASAPNTVARTYTLRSYDAPEVTTAGGANPGNIVNGQNVFTSTVTITARNAGNAPAYNVVIGDALPAELGVLTDTATVVVRDSGGNVISSNAITSNTYSANLHAVSFDNAGIPSLASLPAGATATVTFQVYVRQKPGFCWDPDFFADTDFDNPLNGFQVKPISSPVNQSGRCPSDPYRVINGGQTNDVTATWYTGAPVGQGGHQVLVDFQPNTPELVNAVEIWAVRPVLNVVKTIVDPTGPQPIGTAITYRTTIVNLESGVTDARSARYAALRTEYKDEFDGSKRDNPYARNVKVTDIYGRGLDFVTGSLTALTVSNNNGALYDPAGGANLVSYPAGGFPARAPIIGETGFNWPIIPLMGGGDNGSATYRLMGRLADGQNPDAVWRNCAFLDARNLNQPSIPATRIAPDRNNPVDINLAPDWAPGDSDGNGGVISSFHGVLAERGWDLSLAPTFFAAWPATVTFRPDQSYAAPASLASFYPLNRGLASCVLSAFFEPGRPLIGLTSREERRTIVPSSAILGEAFPNGQRFFYSFRISNTSGAPATNVRLNARITTGTSVVLTTSTAQTNHYLCNASGGACGAALGNATIAGGVVSFGPIPSLAPGQSYVFMIEAFGTAEDGTSRVQAEATWAPNPGDPVLPQNGLPLIVQESTTIE